jgi:hypothetical protein
MVIVGLKDKVARRVEQGGVLRGEKLGIQADSVSDSGSH